MGIQPQQPHVSSQNLSAEDVEPMAHSSVFITIVLNTGGYKLVSTEVGRLELFLSAGELVEPLEMKHGFQLCFLFHSGPPRTIGWSWKGSWRIIIQILWRGELRHRIADSVRVKEQHKINFNSMSVVGSLVIDSSDPTSW